MAFVLPHLYCPTDANQPCWSHLWSHNLEKLKTSCRGWVHAQLPARHADAVFLTFIAFLWRHVCNMGCIMSWHNVYTSIKPHKDSRRSEQWNQSIGQNFRWHPCSCSTLLDLLSISSKHRDRQLAMHGDCSCTLRSSITYYGFLVFVTGFCTQSQKLSEDFFKEFYNGAIWNISCNILLGGNLRKCWTPNMLLWCLGNCSLFQKQTCFAQVC